jgi:hypothetical protein
MAGIARKMGETTRRADAAFLVRQFAINLLVAVVMTVVVTLLLFRGRAAVPLWGLGNVAFDLIPSTLLPTLGATLAMTKATVAAIARGSISGDAKTAYGWLPANDALAGLAIGAGLLAVLGSAFLGMVMFAFAGQDVPTSSLLICKLVYALILCLVNTPIIVARAKLLATRAGNQG